MEKRATRETRTKAFQVGIGIPGVCFPCHTIPSVLQPQVVYSYKKIIEKKKKKKKKNQISVVNSDDITRYYNYRKMIKVSLFSLPLPLLHFGKTKEWNHYVIPRSGNRHEYGRRISSTSGNYFTLKFGFRAVSIPGGFGDF